MKKVSLAKIVIVEDENITALDISMRLQKLGYLVLATCSTGEDAIARTGDLRPDLVLMDIVLKGSIDGIEAATAIRNKFNIPVVFLSAFSDDKTISRAMHSEPFGYVLKPFEERDLYTTIELALYKHKVEENQRQSEERYRLFSETAADFVYSSRVEDGLPKTEWVSEAFLRITGYVLKDLEERGGWTSIIVPEDQARVADEIQAFAEKGSGFCEYRIVTSDGKTRWIRDFIRPVWDEKHENIVRVVGGARDITEEKRAAGKLALSERSYKGLFDAIPDAIYIHGQDGKFIDVNAGAAEMYGYPRDFFIGKTPDVLSAPGKNDIAATQAAITKAAQGEPQQFEWWGVRKNGEIFPKEVRLSKGSYFGNEVVIAIARDVSERKKSSQDLEASQSRLSRLNDCLLSFGPDPDANISSLVSLCGELLNADSAFYVRREGDRMIAAGQWNIPSDLHFSDKAEGRLYTEVILHAHKDACILNHLDTGPFAATDPAIAQFGWKTFIGKAVSWPQNAGGCVGVVYRSDVAPAGDEIQLLEIVASAIGVEEIRRKDQQELRQSENQYRLLFVENPYPIWVYDRDTLYFLAVNEAAVRLYGYSEREFLALRLTDLVVLQADESPVPGVSLSSDGTSAGDVRHKKKDGTFAFMDVIVYPTQFGGKAAKIALMNDVTHKRAADKQIAMLGHAIRSISEAVTVTDLENRVLFVNAAFQKMYGYTEDEILGQSIALVRSPGNSRPDLGLVSRNTLKGGWQLELMNRRKDGSEFPIKLSTSVVYDDRGEAVAMVGVAQDISHQKQLELQVRQAQKMESMGTMVGGISHDFNNILNNILGFVYQLRKYSHDPAKVARYTDTIEKSATRGAELATQLLSFVRQKKRDDEHVSVNALLEEIAALVTETFPKNVQVEKQSDGRAVTVMGNHGELYQAMLNLCLNSRDAMPDGGRLGITMTELPMPERISNAVMSSTLSPGQRCVRVDVSDTGSGIARGILDKVFDPFFTTKERGRGTGLGLAVVYNIVANHRGTIALDTEEGRGSTFSIYLPVVEHQIVKSAEAEEVAMTERHEGLVLLVDDEASMLDLGRELLEDQGYAVLVAHDGRQAVDLYRQRWKDISLVVLDLVMPNLDGGQAYLEMKKINPEIKAFFCTGYSSDNLIASLLSEQQLFALQKPFRPVEFTRMVSEVLAR